MRRLLHTALGGWFLIVMTMAQGCAGPAQSITGTPGARDAISAGVAGGGSSGQYAGAQKSNRTGGPSSTAGYVADPGASTALTDYLKHHRLPLVGAQVMRNPNNGARTVVLYGFVGSDYGKSDAQRQAEDYINDAAVDVDNRIRVNPELLAAGRSPSPSAAGSPDMADAQAQANSSMPGVQSYVDQQNQAAQVQQYQQQNSAASMSSMLPLVALLGILSMASGSGGFSTGPSMGYSPYGNSPSGYSPYGYSPYSPYSPYASPIPPSNFGSPGFSYGSPGGGVTPFGSLPGSPYSSFP
jgi:hypothetical protein